MRALRRSAALSALVLGAALALLVAAGCGGGSGDRPERPPDGERSSAPARPPAEGEALEPARCPLGAVNCRAADGRILYVERVDPDGDGDAHFVLISDESVTAPGITVVDVRRGLRPRPLPGPGGELSAAGPVLTGSLGQRQIQADEVHVARR